MYGLLKKVFHLHNVLPKCAVLVSEIEVCVGVIDATGFLTPVHISDKPKASLGISTGNRMKASVSEDLYYK